MDVQKWNPNMLGEVLVRMDNDRDKVRVEELLELNDLPRRLATKGDFLVAERGREVVAALEYRPAGGQLLLGALIFDLFVEKAPVAQALYMEAHAMAWVTGIREVRAMPTMQGEYPGEVGYHRGSSCWRLEVVGPPRRSEEYQTSGWHKLLSLWDFTKGRSVGRSVSRTIKGE